MWSTIELKGMQFYAYHGFYKEEREKGTNFKVDVVFDAPVLQAVEKDEIEGTVNYEMIYQIVNNEMKIVSKLLEHVAGRILKRIEFDFPTIKNIKVKIYKLEAPLGGKLEHVSVVLESRC